MLDNLRGRTGAGPGPQPKQLEQAAAVALGAALAGAAAGNGWSDSSLAIGGTAALLYGMMSGQFVLQNIGQGILAPVLAEAVRRSFERRAAPAAVPNNVTPYPTAAAR